MTPYILGETKLPTNFYFSADWAIVHALAHHKQISPSRLIILNFICDYEESTLKQFFPDILLFYALLRRTDSSLLNLSKSYWI